MLTLSTSVQAYHPGAQQDYRSVSEAAELASRELGVLFWLHSENVRVSGLKLSVVVLWLHCSNLVASTSVLWIFF